MGGERGDRTDGEAAAPRRKVARRVLFAALGIVLLVWLGGFVVLVVVELDAESRLWGVKDPVVGIDYGTSIRDVMQSIEQASGIGMTLDVAVDADAPADLARREFPAHTNPVMHSVRFAPIRALFLIRDEVDEQLGGRAVAVYYIEGDRIIITTAEQAPSFDASAKAREWYHALEDWWDEL